MHNIQQIGQEKEAKPPVAVVNHEPTPDPEKKDDDENKVSEQPASKQQPKAQPDQ